MPTRDASKIILHLGPMTPTDANRLTRKIGDRCYAVLVDHQIDLMGGNIIHELTQAGAKRVGADVKLHDSPNTAARRAQALAKRGAQIITAHAIGGEQMMQAVVKAIYTESGPAPAIYATLPLVPAEEIDAPLIGQGHRVIATDLACIAKAAKVDSIVCNPWHIEILRDHPDLRGVWLIADLTSPDYSITPVQAIEAGADYIIVGHQVTDAENPEEAFHAIEASINPRVG